MPWRDGDNLLWISLCAFGVFAVYAAKTQLEAVRKASEVTEEGETPELISQHTEDAVDISTLQQLAFHSNHDMRRAAGKIIIERACHPKTISQILERISGQDAEARDQGLKMLKFLVQSGSLTVTPAQLAPTFKALIDCLCAMTNTPTSVPPGDITTHLVRDEPEKSALQLLWHFAYSETQRALRAGLVSRWLAHYPFGGPNSPESRRTQIVTNLRRARTEDLEMNRILVVLDNEPEGRRQLRKHGLMGSAIGETPDDEGGGGGGLFGQGGRAGGRSVMTQYPLPGSRVHDESPEEQALRRRRREAMVLSDGVGPLGSENIIPGRVHDDV